MAVKLEDDRPAGLFNAISRVIDEYKPSQASKADGPKNPFASESADPRYHIQRMIDLLKPSSRSNSTIWFTAVGYRLREAGIQFESLKCLNSIIWAGPNKMMGIDYKGTGAHQNGHFSQKFTFPIIEIRPAGKPSIDGISKEIFAIPYNDSSMAPFDKIVQEQVKAARDAGESTGCQHMRILTAAIGPAYRKEPSRLEKITDPEAFAEREARRKRAATVQQRRLARAP